MKRRIEDTFVYSAYGATGPVGIIVVFPEAELDRPDSILFEYSDGMNYRASYSPQKTEALRATLTKREEEGDPDAS